MGDFYMPHGNCYLWQTSLVGLHVSSDLITAIAYYSIPATLLYFVRQRRDLPFAWLFLLFSGFVLSCGTTHLLEIWTLWHPDYWLSGGVKALTASVSITTAFVLVPVIPKALALPTPAQLEATNAELSETNARLQAEIVARQEVQSALETSQAELRQTLALERQIQAITEKLRLMSDESELWQTVVTDLCCELQDVLNIVFIAAAGESMSAATLDQTWLATLKQQQQVCSDSIAALTQTLDDTVLATPFPVCNYTEQQGVLWVIHQTPLPIQVSRAVQQVGLQGAIAVRQSRLSKAIQQQLDELDRLNRLKDDFVNTVSHELRTPMTSMKLALTMLKPIQASLTAKQSQYWQVLELQCQHEIQLIDDLLDFQSFTASDQLTITATELSEWLPIQLQAVQTLLAENDLNIETAIAPGVVKTDALLLQRVVRELLTNASKYTPTSGSVRVETTLTADACAIAISNSGAPISAIEQLRVFDRFYRSQRDHGKRGTGLGLALVKRHVEQLGGDIELKSDAAWTTFTVRLPLGVSVTLLRSRLLLANPPLD